jgi:hypothetical protein
MLAIYLTQSMIEQTAGREGVSPLVEKLIEAAEDTLESVEASDYFELLLSVEENRREVESAGLMGWMARGEQMYAAPPLLAAAMLLHDDPWTAFDNIYNLVDWVNDMKLLEDGREFLYAPESAACIVESFLDQLCLEL